LAAAAAAALWLAIVCGTPLSGATQPRDADVTAPHAPHAETARGAPSSGATQHAAESHTTVPSTMTAPSPHITQAKELPPKKQPEPEAAPPEGASAGAPPSEQSTAVPEIKVAQRGRRVGGELYCEDCGANKPTMGDPRTNSQPDSRDGVRRWCVRCCEYLNRRPDAQPTHPFSDGWTYGLEKFKPYGSNVAEKPTAWPKNGWTYPNTAPVPRTDNRPGLVKRDTSLAAADRIDPNAEATADLVQAITSAELRPIRPSGLAAEKDDYLPEGDDRPPSPTAGDELSTVSVSRKQRGGGGRRDSRWTSPDSYTSALSSSTTCSGAP
jgi:hypothetical protein